MGEYSLASVAIWSEFVNYIIEKIVKAVVIGKVVRPIGRVRQLNSFENLNDTSV